MGINQAWLDSGERRLRRALHRFYLGRGVEDSYLLVTLTTPEDNKSIDLHDSWRKFSLRLKRRNLKREYFAVREYNKKGTCEHLHVVFRANYLEAEAIREQWSKSCGETSRLLWTKHEYIRDKTKMGRYLAKYLSKSCGLVLSGESIEPTKKHGFWYSVNWIVRKWCSLSKVLRRLGGNFDSVKLELIRKGKLGWFELYGSVIQELKELGMYLDRFEEKIAFIQYGSLVLDKKLSRKQVVNKLKLEARKYGYAYT